MFKLINGWTKETVMAQVKKYNNGSRAVHDGSCSYLTPDGNRCAVGCFIPDGHRGLHSQAGATGLIESYPELAKNMPFEGQILNLFQCAHDITFTGKTVHEAIQNFLDTQVE